MKKILFSVARWGLLGVVLLILDILLKWAATKYFTTPHVVIPGVLNLTLQYNPGIAFSIPIPNAVMIGLTPILIGFVTWLIARTCDLEKSITKLSLILIIVGGMGNLLDRILTGSVIDMIAFSFWPTFNLADSYLTIGTFLLLLFYGKISLSSYGTRNSNKSDENGSK